MSSIVNSVPLPPWVTAGIFGKLVYDLNTIKWDFSNLFQFEKNPDFAAWAGALGASLVAFMYLPPDMRLIGAFMAGGGGVYAANKFMPRS